MTSYRDFRDHIFDFVGAFRSELLLGSISVLIVVISLVISFAVVKKSNNEIEFQSQNENSTDMRSDGPQIFVDIQGAVEKPDVYEVTEGARLKDVLVLADGLSANADREFFTRTFNLAKKMVDQEKIYVPSKDEVGEGRVAGVSSSGKPNTTVDMNSALIGINTASINELDRLPGIGVVTAQKIIDKRPYSSLEELLNKKVVSQSVFAKIKNLISIE